MNTKNSDTRKKILGTAGKLIYQQGIQATSIDLLVKTSGVSRKSIYHYFVNKDEIAAAVLEARDLQWMEWFCRETEKVTHPRARILEMFNVLTGWFNSPDFHGCAFINTAGEMGNPADPLRLISKSHKQKLLNYALLLCELAGCAQPAILARQLLILIDGAITVAKVMGDPEAAENAKTIAITLLDKPVPAPV
ncbi:TetR/AcrR family transcriptional regulator [Erwinia tasmaniensis]|uniref:TetR/AcrR family transcriptional regulator n=1 Tax=Erwinia tasmaniensis TaxID=338565 RepID=UPI003A4D9F56